MSLWLALPIFHLTVESKSKRNYFLDSLIITHLSFRLRSFLLQSIKSFLQLALKLFTELIVRWDQVFVPFTVAKDFLLHPERSEESFHEMVLRPRPVRLVSNEYLCKNVGEGASMAEEEDVVDW